MKRVLITIAFILFYSINSSAQQQWYELEISKVADAVSFELVSGRKIKMLGVELVSGKANEALSFIESVVKPGESVYFEVDKVLTDDENNIIGYIYTKHLFLNVELIKRGYARYTDKYPVSLNVPQFQDNYVPEKIVESAPTEIKIPESFSTADILNMLSNQSKSIETFTPKSEIVETPEKEVKVVETPEKEVKSYANFSAERSPQQNNFSGDSFILGGGEIKELPNYKMLYLENLTLHWQSNTMTSALFSYVNPFDDLIAKGWHGSLTFGKFLNYKNIMSNNAMPYISASVGVANLDLQDINYSEAYFVKTVLLVDVSYNFGIMYKRKNFIARIEFKNNNYYNHRNNTIFDGKTYLFGIGYKYRSF